MAIRASSDSAACQRKGEVCPVTKLGAICSFGCGQHSLKGPEPDRCKQHIAMLALSCMHLCTVVCTAVDTHLGLFQLCAQLRELRLLATQETNTNTLRHLQKPSTETEHAHLQPLNLCVGLGEIGLHQHALVNSPGRPALKTAIQRRTLVFSSSAFSFASSAFLRCERRRQTHSDFLHEPTIATNTSAP